MTATINYSLPVSAEVVVPFGVDISDASGKHIGVAVVYSDEPLLLHNYAGYSIDVRIKFYPRDYVAFTAMMADMLNPLRTASYYISANVLIPAVKVKVWGLSLMSILQLPVVRNIQLLPAIVETIPRCNVTQFNNTMDCVIYKISQILAGDPQLMYYTSRYMHLDDLILSNTTNDFKLPFDIRVTMKNPTNVQLVSVGLVNVDLQWSNKTIVNVNVRNMSLLANGWTSFRVTGDLLTRDTTTMSTVVDSILSTMSSKNYSQLPFTLSGTRTNATIDTLSSIQSMLSTKHVQVGHLYTKLGPPTANGSIALAQVFANIPVLRNLGDTLLGMQMVETAKIVAGKIPVHVKLHNPFQCPITLRAVEVVTYVPPHMVKSPVGWVRNTEPYTMQPNVTAVSSSFLFNFNLLVVTRVVGDIKQLAHMIASDQLQVSLIFSKLHVDVCGAHLMLTNLSGVHNVTLFPRPLVTKLGWLNTIGLLFNRKSGGWNMLSNLTGIFTPSPTSTSVASIAANVNIAQ